MKPFAFVLSLLVCANAWADWTRVDRAEGVEVYVDSATIRKSGNTIKMWSLFNFHAAKLAVTGL